MPKKGNDWINWTEDVICIVRSIPFGKVCTYGLIAQAIGKPGAARMVGWVLNRCHTDPHIPCHRVVNRMGMLSGKLHFPSPDAMENALKSEGILVENDQILNFENHLWNPNLE
jgi:methylated-DNA-protein-cysteine methyltransferase-like protein